MTEDRLKRESDPEGDIERLRHALMNPLTVVVGYAQMIASDPGLDADTRSRADLVLAQAKECVRIVESWRQRAVSPGSGPRPAKGRDAPRESRSGQVLVVDDEDIIRTLARQVLGSIHEVETCETADDALRRIMVGEYDVILIDLNLKGATGGIGLYETLKVQHPELADRVVFMSGGVVGDEEARLLEESGRPYVQKPFNIEELRALVQRVLGP